MVSTGDDGTGMSSGFQSTLLTIVTSIVVAFITTWGALNIADADRAQLMELARAERSQEIRIHEDNKDVKMIEIAASILTIPPDPKNEALRKWAVDVIDKFAPVPLEADARKELYEMRLAPFGAGGPFGAVPFGAPPV